MKMNLRLLGFLFLVFFVFGACQNECIPLRCASDNKQFNIHSDDIVQIKGKEGYTEVTYFDATREIRTQKVCECIARVVSQMGSELIPVKKNQHYVGKRYFDKLYEITTINEKREKTKVYELGSSLDKIPERLQLSRAAVNEIKGRINSNYIGSSSSMVIINQLRGPSESPSSVAEAKDLSQPNEVVGVSGKLGTEPIDQSVELTERASYSDHIPLNDMKKPEMRAVVSESRKFSEYRFISKVPISTEEKRIIFESYLISQIGKGSALEVGVKEVKEGCKTKPVKGK